jgi:hypothetical protein
MKNLRRLTMVSGVLLALAACQSERERAEAAALARYAEAGGRLIGSVSQSPNDWSISTEICVIIELPGEKPTLRDVVFVRVSGVDDDAMQVAEATSTFAECKAGWWRG